MKRRKGRRKIFSPHSSRGKEFTKKSGRTDVTKEAGVSWDLLKRENVKER